ncbi:MAG: hypothetical protein HQL44_08800 [Alphaproteobacteria bacterium]|nr:hypothetical protein [Alphaproteobacteria bacterium]
MSEPIVRVYRGDELPKVLADALEGVEADALYIVRIKKFSANDPANMTENEVAEYADAVVQEVRHNNKAKPVPKQ